MRWLLSVVAISIACGGSRGPVLPFVPPGASFNNSLDVLLVHVLTDDGDTSTAAVERVFRGPEQPGPIAIRWNIAAGGSGDEVRAGDRLIVAGVFAAGQFFAQAAYRGDDVQGRLPPPPRGGAPQLASFLFLLAMPLLQTALYFVAKRRREWMKVSLSLPLLAIADYWYYESGIPRYMNIRIDLLILLPVAALIALLWVLLAVRPWNRDGLRREPR